MTTKDDSRSQLIAVLLILIGVPFALWFMNSTPTEQHFITGIGFKISAICIVQPGLLFTAKYLVDWPNDEAPTPWRKRIKKAVLTVVLGILLPLELLTVFWATFWPA